MECIPLSDNVVHLILWHCGVGLGYDFLELLGTPSLIIMMFIYQHLPQLRHNARILKNIGGRSVWTTCERRSRDFALDDLSGIMGNARMNVGSTCPCHHSEE